MSHRIRGAANRREVVKSWERSGLSAAQFARLIGASQWTLYGWRRQLRAGANGASRAPEPPFVEVVPATERSEPGSAIGVVPRPVATASVPLEVVVGDIVVRVPHDFDARTLRRVVAALRTSPTEQA